MYYKQIGRHIRPRASCFSSQKKSCVKKIIIFAQKLLANEHQATFQKCLAVCKTV